MTAATIAPDAPALGDLVTPTGRLVLPAGAGEQEWHTARLSFLGGSEVAGVLGLDRHNAPLTIWHKKRGTYVEVKPAFVKRAAKWGHRLEAIIAEVFAEESGKTVLPTPGTLVHVDRPWMGVNLDGQVLEPGALTPTAVLECKNRSQYQSAEWGADDDDLPDEPAIQAIWGMAVSGHSHAYVAALIGGNDLRWYRIERDEELIAHLIERTGDWWQRHIVEGAEPAPGGSKADKELLAHLWESPPEATVEVDEAQAQLLIARRTELKAQAKSVETSLREVENQMKAMTGDAEIAMAGGVPVWTWKRNSTFQAKQFRENELDLVREFTIQVPGLDLKRLQKEHPDIYRAYRARQLKLAGAPR
jgi:putative phage-type endonuclease